MKRASIVYFYFGEGSYLTRLGQEVGTPIGSVLVGKGGYDYSVLLHADPSKDDRSRASLVLEPTRNNFLATLESLRDGYDAVDVFILSHGNPGVICMQDGDLTAKTVSALKPFSTLRALYGCNCFGSSMLGAWHNIGLKVGAGAHGVNFYPTEWVRFSRAWVDGVPFADAVKGSETSWARTGPQAYIIADAAARAKAWGGNMLSAATVLGGGSASRKYFETCWGASWDQSGKETMNRSSAKQIVGATTLRWDDETS